jgi:hypothetical protein
MNLPSYTSLDLTIWDDKFLFVVFRVRGIPPPQSSVAAVITSDRVRLDDVQDSRSLALIPRHDCQLRVVPENVVNHFGNVSIHAPALVVVPGKHKEDSLLICRRTYVRSLSTHSETFSRSILSTARTRALGPLPILLTSSQPQNIVKL